MDFSLNKALVITYQISDGRNKLLLQIIHFYNNCYAIKQRLIDKVIQAYFFSQHSTWSFDIDLKYLYEKFISISVPNMSTKELAKDNWKQPRT